MNSVLAFGCGGCGGEAAPTAAASGSATTAATSANQRKTASETTSSASSDRREAIFRHGAYLLGYNLAMAALGSEENFPKAEKMAKAIDVRLARPPSGREQIVDYLLGPQGDKIVAAFEKLAPSAPSAYLLACDIMLLALVFEPGKDHKAFVDKIETHAKGAEVSEVVAPMLEQLRTGKATKDDIIKLGTTLDKHLEKLKNGCRAEAGARGTHSGASRRFAAPFVAAPPALRSRSKPSPQHAAACRSTMTMPRAAG